MADVKDPRSQNFETKVDYKRRFIKPDDPDAILHDVYLILRHDEKWKGAIAEDQFAQRIVKLKAPPYEPAEGFKAGEWSEIDDARTAIWLAQQHGMKKVALGTVGEAVMTVANDNAFHPVRQYLDSLVWDGVERVDMMLGEYLEAPLGEEDLMRYTTLISRVWMISAVARIYEPGCKADYVLILEGNQRIGKSTFLDILAGAWFSDTPFEIRDKDAYQHLTGKWIIELQELDSFNKAEVTRLKAFFSSRVDNYRPPYGRRNRDFPRQCVFAGTTNQNEYLRDNTGNLRFMPVYVRRLLAERLVADRDQLWAEAVHRYKAGEPWFPTWEEFELMSRYQSLREISDPWEDEIEIWLRGQAEFYNGDVDPVTVNRILYDVLGMSKSAENLQYKSSKVGRILRKFGWKPKQFTRDIDRKLYGRNYYEKVQS